MPRPFSFLSRKKSSATLPFKDYYEDWFNTLKNTLLPLLHQSLDSRLPSLLPFRRDLLLQHFLSYYDFLDLAASDDVSQVLFPSWRNPLEIPFLFLGDLHPYVFTNLLRSFIDAANNEEEDTNQTDVLNDPVNGSVLVNLESLDKPWQVLTAWMNPSENLILRLEQIECGLRLMVPALVSRVKKIHGAFLGRVAEKWAGYEGKKGIEEAVNLEMEETLAVVVDANRLRRSVITEIVNATDVYQGSLFLEGLSQFLVGFKDPILVGEYERCKAVPISGGVHWGS